MSNLLVFNRKKLIDALSYGAICAGSNKTMPILDYIRITAKEGESIVSIESNNLSVAAKISVDAEQPATCDLDLCVMADGFQKVLSTLTDYNVTLEFEEPIMRVKHGSGSAKFPVLPSNEYPHRFDEGQNEPLSRCEMPSQTLKYILNSSRNFIGNDELRPSMMTTNLTFMEDGIEYCATDAHKMICEKIPLQNIVGAGTILCIPKATHRVLLGLVGEEDESVVIQAYENFAIVSVGNKDAAFTLSEGKFPNYRAIIPKESVNKFTVSKDELMLATKRMEMLSNITTKTAVFECSNQSITVFAENVDFGTGGIENVYVGHYIGNNQPLKIGFNTSFLNTCLSEIASHDVVLNINEANRAVVFTDTTKPAKIVLVMPVMID